MACQLTGTLCAGCMVGLPERRPETWFRPRAAPLSLLDPRGRSASSLRQREPCSPPPGPGPGEGAGGQGRPPDPECRLPGSGTWAEISVTESVTVVPATTVPPCYRGAQKPPGLLGAQRPCGLVWWRVGCRCAGVLGCLLPSPGQDGPCGGWALRQRALSPPPCSHRGSFLQVQSMAVLDLSGCLSPGLAGMWGPSRIPGVWSPWQLREGAPKVQRAEGSCGASGSSLRLRGAVPTVRGSPAPPAPACSSKGCCPSAPLPPATAPASLLCPHRCWERGAGTWQQDCTLCPHVVSALPRCQLVFAG